jgi:glutamine synthetase
MLTAPRIARRIGMKGTLDLETFTELAEGEEIDTILCMFTDLQGRFVGKRVVPHFFLEEIMGEEGLHACLYLLAIDMEMEPLPGYAYASWETGYGDFRMIPDMSTLRWCPWLEKTVMVICDVADEETSEPIEVAPRQILKRQIARAAEKGYVVKSGSELEFYLFRDGFDAIAESGYRTLRPSSSYIMDYHMLQTTKDEWIIRQIRNGMLGAGVPIEFSKGEFGRGQHEINITYADALATADYHSIYKHGVKEICAANGVASTFMAKYTMAEAGSSCHMHSSVWSADGTESLMWSDDGEHHLTETFRHYLGGLMSTAREMSFLYAPFVNSYKRYQHASWAPTAIVWSRDNRTCGFRTVGEHKGFRVECRIPGADVNPYLGYAATIASGLWGIENQVEPPEMYVGNAYEAKDVPRVPYSLHEAIETFRGSAVAREAFGDFVFEHLLNTAVQEQSIFDNTCVTDWELTRYFERG